MFSPILNSQSTNVFNVHLVSVSTGNFWAIIRSFSCSTAQTEKNWWEKWWIHYSSNNAFTIQDITDTDCPHCIFYLKVHIFWEGHKNLAHLPLIIWDYILGNAKKQWKVGQIFVAFSEYLNFNQVSKMHGHGAQ